MFCPSCGKGDQARDSYCRSCGEFLTSLPQADYAHTAPAGVTEEKTKILENSRRGGRGFGDT